VRPPDALFRVDGSARMGTGHVMRCLTLADALGRRGFRATFVSRTLHPALADLIRQAGHDLHLLSPDGPAPLPEQGDYGLWLGTTQAHDARATCAWARATDLDPPTLLVVDHYGLDREWEEIVRAEFPDAPMLCIDDLDRPHVGDVVVDSTLAKSADAYRGRVPDGCTCLVGAEFALLRPDFAELRPQTLAARDAAYAQGRPARHVLINMGGADEPDATGWVIDGLAQLAQAHGLTLHVLVGAAYPHGARLDERRSALGSGLEIHREIRDMAGFLAEMDLAIGAAGSSAWERCCLGLPSVMLVIADNQRGVARALADTGAAVDGGIFDPQVDPTSWAREIVEPLLPSDQLASLSMTARELVDGRGVTRAISAGLAPRIRSGHLALRPARMEDARLMHEWQSDPATRRFAVNPSVPAWADHLNWLDRKLSDQDCSFYIAVTDGIAAGIARLDKSTCPSPAGTSSHRCREVSIVTAPEFYGCGVALRALLELQRQHRLEIQIARILPGNTASHSLFAKAGYRPFAPDLFFWSSVETSQRSERE
jgi:UDP-2,4-diacetamido-2,4,6-trideoxy-beta-L-altropyranose hydrolase